jgi:hypothetical protein
MIKAVPRLILICSFIAGLIYYWAKHVKINVSIFICHETEQWLYQKDTKDVHLEKIDRHL